MFIASDPPFKITALPDLKHRPATSDVTLGLLSKITPITPIGIVTLFIFNPFGLLHFLRVTFTGSFSFEILMTESLIFLSFTLSICSLLIRFSLIPIF